MKYKYDVFISYSRRDYVDENYNVIPGNAIAEIQNVFDENGITYWFDKDGIYSGQEFIEIITGAIAESKMLIFISSKHSNESMWTAGEIFEALDGEKAIIPVKIDNCQYNKKFKLLIRPLDYIDYQENPQNALKDLLRAINKVKEDIAQKQREEEKLRQEKEAEAKKEKIKEEISILAKDCQRLTLQQIDVVNQIFEKQTYIGNTKKPAEFKTFPLALQQSLRSYCLAGGHLMLSGAYIASDFYKGNYINTDERIFSENILKYKFKSAKASLNPKVKMVNSPFAQFNQAEFEFYDKPNKVSYSLESTDAIEPAGDGAVTICRYAGTHLSAGVAYSGNYKVCSFGFPFETIQSEKERNRLMESVLDFFNAKSAKLSYTKK